MPHIMTNESHLLHQERCPKCTEEGHDRAGDNLSVYSDGHSYCFRCGFYIPSSGISRLLFRNTVKETHAVVLPYDVDINYPQVALDWIGQYELNQNDLLSNNAVYSPSKDRLYFTVYGPEGLLAYQGRYFGKDNDQKKWWGKGDFKNIFALFGKTGRSLVVVEDVISAIKISRFTQSWWLAGNHVGIDRWRRLYKIIPKGLRIEIFLDPDMDRQSILQAELGRSCGLNVGIIFASKDPKELPFNILKGILDGEREG